MSERVEATVAPAAPPGSPVVRRVLTVRNFAVFSVIHSVLFTGLMVCAFALAKPQPATFVFGFTHGVLYIVMGVACIVAARLRIVPVTTALVVVIVGLFGPYFGAYEFVRADRARPDEEPFPDAP
jgi:hypothetical protein